VAARNTTESINTIIHERARLLILTLLASYDQNEMVFTELQKRLELTAGNLSVQLKTLEKNNYVTITKQFIANKPQTSVSITDEGRKALEAYLSEIEQLILRIKKDRKAS
jgi:DNA-binding MarR family transcriptional regulator